MASHDYFGFTSRTDARVRQGWILVLGLVLAVGASAPRAAAATVVDCTASSGALATALASANDGDTLAIQGACKGTFEIAHDLTLVGSGGASLDGHGTNAVVVRIDAGKTVHLTNLTVTGGGSRAGGPPPLAASTTPAR